MSCRAGNHHCAAHGGQKIQVALPVSHLRLCTGTVASPVLLHCIHGTPLFWGFGCAEVCSCCNIEVGLQAPSFSNRLTLCSAGHLRCAESGHERLSPSTEQQPPPKTPFSTVGKWQICSPADTVGRADLISDPHHHPCFSELPPGAVRSLHSHLTPMRLPTPILGHQCSDDAAAQ